MILITGSSGFLGTNLINFFLKKKIKFIGIDKKKSAYLNNLNLKIADITNKKKIEKIFERYKPQKVIHLAAISGVGSCQKDIQKAFKTNIEGTFNILFYAKKYQCKKVLLASSFASDKFNTNPNYYGYTKKTLEDMALTFKKNFNLNVAVLKFSNIYGSFSLHKNSAIHQIIKCNLKKTHFKLHGTGKQSRDFIHVDSVTKLIFKVLKSNKLPLINFINTNKLTRIIDILHLIDQISKFKTKYKFIKAPDGYDIKIKKNNNRPNKNLIINLKKTFNWYRSNYK